MCLRREQRVPCRVRVGEVPPGPDTGFEDSNSPQTPCPGPLEQREAQQVAQAEEEGSKEAGTSQPEVPTHGEPPGILIRGGGGEWLPMKTVPYRERVLVTTHEILGCIHALHLQTMHEMGSMREVDWTLA